jgi:hypothetical protein
MKITSDESEDAFSGQTVPLDVEMDNEVKEAVVTESQQQYGTPKASVEAYLETLFNPKEAQDENEGKPKSSASKKKLTRRKARKAKT